MAGMIFKAITTAMVAVVASVSMAGPVRLATSFFMPTGRINPVVLDAKADASGNFVTAALADVTGGGQQIVITQFTAAGVRRWSSTITTPVPASAPVSQVASKFQILLDGVGNTYVLSPRAGNPLVAGTTEDLLVRKISDTGAIVGYLSLVGYLNATTGQTFNVKNAQLQNGPPLTAEVGLALTAADVWQPFSNAYMLQFGGGVSGGAITVNGIFSQDGSFYFDWFSGDQSRIAYSVVGLKEGNASSLPVGTPKYRLILKREEGYTFSGMSGQETAFQTMSAWFDPSAHTTLESQEMAPVLGFQAEGVGSSPDQVVVFDQFYSGGRNVTRLGSSTLRSPFGLSDVPFTATHVANDWLVYRRDLAGNKESLLKFATTGAIAGAVTPITISTATAAPYFAGASIVTANERAYLAGGPTAAGVQGIYSSFNSDGDLVYSAGLPSPFTLSTSFVVPTANNRFWTFGRTSTGLQAAILWQEPVYFAGISSWVSASPSATVTVKAHLNAPAPSGGYRIRISVSSNLQSAPLAVNVPAGATSAAFTVDVKRTATVGTTATVTARTDPAHDINTAHTATIKIN